MTYINPTREPASAAKNFLCSVGNFTRFLGGYDPDKDQAYLKEAWQGDWERARQSNGYAERLRTALADMPVDKFMTNFPPGKVLVNYDQSPPLQVPQYSPEAAQLCKSCLKGVADPFYQSQILKNLSKKAFTKLTVLHLQERMTLEPTVREVTQELHARMLDYSGQFIGKESTPTERGEWWIGF